MRTFVFSLGTSLYCRSGSHWIYTSRFASVGSRKVKKKEWTGWDTGTSHLFSLLFHLATTSLPTHPLPVSHSPVLTTTCPHYLLTGTSSGGLFHWYAGVASSHEHWRPYHMCCCHSTSTGEMHDQPADLSVKIGPSQIFVVFKHVVGILVYNSVNGSQIRIPGRMDEGRR